MHQAQRVRRRLRRKAPGGANQLGVPVVHALIERRPRVQIDGHAEVRHRLPERQQPRRVEVFAAARVVHVGVAVDHRALESERGHRALELARRATTGSCSATLASPANRAGYLAIAAGQEVVDVARRGGGQRRIDDALRAGHGVREQADVDAGGVHRGDALVELDETLVHERHPGAVVAHRGDQPRQIDLLALPGAAARTLKCSSTATLGSSGRGAGAPMAGSV